jgi:hypothetical protein
MQKRGELLLHEAFAGPQPVRDFEQAGPGSNAWTGETFNTTSRFLRELGDNADQLPKERRPYWRQRKAAPRPDGSVLAELSLQDEWLRVVN